MAFNYDVTDANAVFAISVPLWLPLPTQLQGFGMDDIFSTANVTPVQTQMGVDGQLSGGYVPTEKKTTITLAASSASNDFFDAWFAGMDGNLAAYAAEGVITLPSRGSAYTLIRGFLTGYLPINDAKKILQPRRFEITWQSIVRIPVGAAG